MKDDSMLFFAGILTGMFIVVVILFASGDRDMSQQGFEAIKQCEAELPRNKSCIIMAVPEEVKE